MATKTLTRTLTHAELLAEISAGTLHKGESITISDYRTVHTIPNTSDTNTGDLEPLLVTAISNNELKPEAYSVAFPDDVIYYNPINDQSKVPGCIKGFIYRRIDTKKSNDFPFDFRQVKFRRWQIDAPEWLVGTTYAKGNVVNKVSTNELYISLVDSNTGNEVTDGAFWRRFEWDNLTYVSWTNTSWMNAIYNIPCTTLFIDYNFFADGDYTTCYNNVLEMYSDDLLSYSNTVVFGANFNNNSIGAGFNNNSIGAGFNNNSIGASFNNNSIGANFNTNTIGWGFNNNSIAVNFYNNNVGIFISSNNIAEECYSNNIMASFNNNIIGAFFQYNNVLPNLINKNLTSIAELYNKLYPHTLSQTTSVGIVITWYNSTGVLQSLFVA